MNGSRSLIPTSPEARIPARSIFVVNRRPGPGWMGIGIARKSGMNSPIFLFLHAMEGLLMPPGLAERC